MTLFLSSSSSLASAAIFGEHGALIAEASREAPMAASGPLVEMSLNLVREAGITLEDIDVFGADVGPGSFTGTRVAVTLAKVFAYTAGASCVGATSFDLIAANRTVAIPSKKGEYFVRKPGEQAVRTAERPKEELVGFGPWFEQGTWPLAARAGVLLPSLTPVSPEEFVPEYGIEPSISIPKKRMGGHVG